MTIDSLQKAVDTLRFLSGSPIRVQHTSFEYAEDGTVRAIVALETEATDARQAVFEKLRSHDIPLSGNPHESLTENAPVVSNSQGSDSDNTGIPNPTEALVGCLVDALFLALDSSSTTPSRSGVEESDASGTRTSEPHRPDGSSDTYRS